MSASRVVNDKLASIPSESTVHEWAHFATKEYFDTSSKVEEITPAGSTINSSITASSQTGAVNVRNEVAKVMEGITDGREKAMEGIVDGLDKAIVAVTNKIVNMGAY